MVCALFGLTSPANRGGLLTTLLLLYVFMGSFAGYSSARIYKLCNGKEWKLNTLYTATFYPGVIGIIFLGINGLTAFYGSSTASPITTLLGLLSLWFGISTPLVFIGSYYGFKAETIAVPVRTNQIARHIPDQVWYTHPVFSVALGGILPFGAVCIELFFIMSAMWLHQVSFNLYSFENEFIFSSFFLAVLCLWILIHRLSHLSSNMC
jgi:transmembrane 9 superfamily protein 2/4